MSWRETCQCVARAIGKQTRAEVPGVPARRWSRRLRTWAVAELAAYFLLALATTWPLARSVASALPLGTEPAATVPLLNVWTVWWNADRAAHGYRGYWDAPIFAPTPATFAFSEPMPTTLVVAPLIWWGGHRVLAYNAFLLAALTLNGWAAFRLLRAVRLRWLACLAGGGIVQLLPFVHGELGVLQMVPLCGVLWTIHALVRFGNRPSGPRAIMLAFAFAATFFTCAYYGVFLSLLLLLCGAWLLGRRLREGRTWAWLLASAGVALLLIAPVVATQLRVIHDHHLRRSQDWVARLAADVRDYAVTPWPQAWEPSGLASLRAKRYFRLGPGWLKIVLAVAGLAAGLHRRRFRAWAAFCGTLLVAAFLLSLGPRLAWNGWSLYGTLMDWYPGMAQARNVYRFAAFVQLAVALLAALGLDAGLSRCRTATRQVWRVCHVADKAGGRPAGSCRVSFLGRAWKTGLGTLASLGKPLVLAGLGLLAMLEVWPEPPPLYPVPARETQRGWIEWLQKETPADCLLACFPFVRGTGVRDYEPTARWMYWGTYHRRRLVNGYSGFFPASFLETKAAVGDFPSDVSLRRLEELGVEYCVVDAGETSRRAGAGRGLVLVFQDVVSGVEIYRVPP